MQIREVMNPNPQFCTPQTKLEEVAMMMVDCDCGAIPVVQLGGRRVIGVVTDRDIACRAVAKRRNPIGLLVEEVMTSPVQTVGLNASLDEALRIMERHQIRRLPVVDDSGDLIGIIAQADVARKAPEHETAELVRDVSLPSSSPGISAAQVH